MTSPRKKAAEYDVPALRKGVKLLELLCDSESPLGVSDISRELGVNKHMVFRLLRTYIDEGWITAEGDGPKYRVSLRPFHYASKPLARTDLMQSATLLVRDLWSEIGESVGLAVLDDDRVMYLMHLNSTRDVAVSGRVGARYLLHCSAPGKVFLSEGPDSLFDRVVAEGLPAQTKNTIVKPEKLRQELAVVRKRGYALDLEEYADGVICFGAPIRNHGGAVVAALNVSALNLHHTKSDLVNDLGRKVLDAAAQISRKL